MSRHGDLPRHNGDGPGGVCLGVSGPLFYDSKGESRISIWTQVRPDMGPLDFDSSLIDTVKEMSAPAFPHSGPTSDSLLERDGY